MAFMTESNAPATRLKLSWVSFVAPSMEKLTLWIPESFIFCAVSIVTKNPHGAITILSPMSVPCRARSQMSSLNMGSPPVIIIMGSENDFTSSRNLMHSSVVSSFGYGPKRAAARQCMQLRLQDLVSSHAISLGSHIFPTLPSGGLASDFAPWP